MRLATAHFFSSRAHSGSDLPYPSLPLPFPSSFLLYLSSSLGPIRGFASGHFLALSARGMLWLCISLGCTNKFSGVSSCVDDYVCSISCVCVCFVCICMMCVYVCKYVCMYVCMYVVCMRVYSNMCSFLWLCFPTRDRWRSGSLDPISKFFPVVNFVPSLLSALTLSICRGLRYHILGGFCYGV